MTKDKFVDLTCEKCHTDYRLGYNSYSTRRKRKLPNLCPKCMKERLSKIRKNYYHNLSEEEKKVFAEKRNWHARASEEEKEKFREKMKNVYHSLTDEEKEELNRKNSEGLKRHWATVSEEDKKKRTSPMINRTIELLENMTPEERSKRSKHIWKKIKPDRKKELIKLYQRKMKKYNDSLSYEEKLQRANLMNKQMRELPKEERKEIAKRAHDWVRNLSLEEYMALGDVVRQRWNNRSPEEKAEMIKKLKEKWENKSPEEKAEIMRKRFKNGNGRSSLHDKFESYFKASEINNHFYYVSEDIFSREGVTHSWDYGIYDENGELQMLVDLDGSYYHGDCCDYDGLHSQEEYDEKRFLSVPDGVKYHIIYEKEWTKSFEMMIKLLMGKTYDEFVQDMFKHCRLLPDLPYMHYTDIELLKSYDQLLNLKVDKYRKNVSINNREGDRIINHFHHSIYQAKCKGFKYSPYDAWYRDDLLLKIIKNRIVYINKINPNKILQGFNIAKVAKRVTVFSAGRAKILIENFLDEFDTIFDPFSGFSGRMLGTVAARKKYIGQDISEIHVRESKQIINFFKGYKFPFDADVRVKNIFASSGEYSCLFTCPPYADKEQWYGVDIDMRTCDDWIDICMERFKCKKYLFVVDKTEKYKKYVLDDILNKSHMGKNNEYILLIEK